VVSRWFMLLIMLVAALAAGGASCPRSRRLMTPPPAAFTQVPTAQEIVQTINANSERIRQLQTAGASLVIPGMPSLRGSLALERPRRMRLLADTPLTGAEFDLGSNDEVFWMWVKRNQSPAVYFARHAAFATSAMQHMFPVPPDWLIEAVGVVRLDPQAPIEGPYSRPNGQWEIRSRLAVAGSELPRVIVIDGTYGWIVQQTLYDARGQTLAIATASQHEYDPVSGVTLPRLIEVQLPPAGLTFTLRVERYLVNQLYGDPTQLWAMPRLDGHQYVDLADPRTNLSPPVSGPAPTVPPTASLTPWPVQGSREPLPPPRRWR